MTSISNKISGDSAIHIKNMKDGQAFVLYKFEWQELYLKTTISGHCCFINMGNGRVLNDDGKGGYPVDVEISVTKFSL